MIRSLAASGRVRSPFPSTRITNAGAVQGKDRVFDTSCAARCREASRGLACCPDAARTAFCAAVPGTSCRPTFARRFATSTGRVTGALRTGFGSRRLSTLESSTPCLGGTGNSAPETAWSGFMRLRKKRRRIRGRWKSLHPVISWKDFQRPEGLRLPAPRSPRWAPVDSVANTPENTSARIAGLRALGATWPPGGCPLSGSLIFV